MTEMDRAYIAGLRLVMNKEKDRFIVEALGGVWHGVRFWESPNIMAVCLCGTAFSHNENLAAHIQQAGLDLETPEGFFWWWERAQKEEWWEKFIYGEVGKVIPKGMISKLGAEGYCVFNMCNLIHPTRGRDALYEFLKERKGKR